MILNVAVTAEGGIYTAVRRRYHNLRAPKALKLKNPCAKRAH